MNPDQSQPPTGFVRELRFRSLENSKRMLRVLEDHAGFFYVLKLHGTPEFGPYLLEELVGAFGIEREPFLVLDIGTWSTPNDSGDRE